MYSSSRPDDEVEDSEPERERLRLEFKASKREERRLRKEAAAAATKQGAQVDDTEPIPLDQSPDTDDSSQIASADAHPRLTQQLARDPPSPNPPSPLNVSIASASSSTSSLKHPHPPSSSSSIPSKYFSRPPPSQPFKAPSFVPRPSPTPAATSELARRSLTPSVVLSSSSEDDEAGEKLKLVCPFKDTEMRRIKQCVLCGEDWKSGRKFSRTKWVRASRSQAVVACHRS
jgi:hypothetical protein